MGHISGGLGSKALKTYALLDEIITVLGTTKTTLWPCFESEVGDGATETDLKPYGSSNPTTQLKNLISADAGSAINLRNEFEPIQHVSGIYSYHIAGGNNNHFRGTDRADYSFAGDAAFSVGIWMLRTNASGNTQSLLAKYGSTANLEEWDFRLGSANTLQLELHDASASTSEIGTSGTAIEDNLWHFCVATYDGTAATPAVNFYLDGAVDNDGDGSVTTESGAYVGMEDTASILMVGARDATGTPAQEFVGRITLPFICGVELTSANISTLYSLGQTLLGL